jgi:hypothetical protein
MDREYKLNIEALFYPLSVSKSRYKIAHIFVDDGFHISVSPVAVSPVAVDFLSIGSNRHHDQSVEINSEENPLRSTLEIWWGDKKKQEKVSKHRADDVSFFSNLESR